MHHNSTVRRAPLCGSPYPHVRDRRSDGPELVRLNLGVPVRMARAHHGMDGGDVVRVLITGATGTLGWALCSVGRRFGHDMLGVSRTKPPGFKECEWRPLDVRDGKAVTAGGAVNVAVACAERGVRQLLMSTDAVFASRDEGYREEEPPSPVTPYGAAKAAAAPVRAGGPRPRLRYELGSAAHPSSLPRV